MLRALRAGSRSCHFISTAVGLMPSRDGVFANEWGKGVGRRKGGRGFTQSIKSTLAERFDSEREWICPRSHSKLVAKLAGKDLILFGCYNKAA